MFESYLSEYKDYCVDRYGSGSGTATSYTNALKYLIEYLCISNIAELLPSVKSLEPDIRDKDSMFYQDLLNFYVERGQGSYLIKGFLKAAIAVLYDFSAQKTDSINADIILLPEIKDNQIAAEFNIEKLQGKLPISKVTPHDYSARKISGTSSESSRKVRSGRAAEKYFMSFLSKLGFVQGVDYFDVANNKNFGYDIRFHDIGLEIKNIKSGGFYLTDNEIARLENTASPTTLILVDVDNGIWMLKNNSNWLKQNIENIKVIRSYCESKYPNLDLSDIKICLDDKIICDVIEISGFKNKQILSSVL